MATRQPRFECDYPAEELPVLLQPHSFFDEGLFVVRNGSSSVTPYLHLAYQRLSIVRALGALGVCPLSKRQLLGPGMRLRGRRFSRRSIIVSTMSRRRKDSLPDGWPWLTSSTDTGSGTPSPTCWAQPSQPTTRPSTSDSRQRVSSPPRHYLHPISTVPRDMRSARPHAAALSSCSCASF